MPFCAAHELLLDRTNAGLLRQIFCRRVRRQTPQTPPTTTLYNNNNNDDDDDDVVVRAADTDTVTG